MTASQILAQPDHDAARLLYARLTYDEAWLLAAVKALDARHPDEYLQSFRRQLLAGKQELSARQVNVARRRIRPYCLRLVRLMRERASAR